ncbi:DL-endopeptidase inhibitor IseA family protein [Neobacillus sp. PS2-9]|uniref:DL-endopeptidase inhibitor IseA family protein n=1 Tax=Neobacillus sp. PS2-9 TaxID=3070676 RepID=UPI0027DECD91|nr:DL-endopeptidase inhibitor IseA family protein [Neobacillus sp. PS2-9]WML55959.1 DL-endopeptidase inhibitor IseA family protein [Neobacillus sp. PS2-9]
MNEKMYDNFLQPLKNRPGMQPDQEFKENLHKKLSSMAHEQKRAKKGIGKHLIPNLLTAAILFIGIFAGYEVIFKEKHEIESKHSNHSDIQDVNQVELSEQKAKETVGIAFVHASVLYNGGGPEMGEVFSYNGKSYRYMVEDFITKEKVLAYLEEVYTKEVANRIYGAMDFIEYNGKLAQPNRQMSGNLLWQDAEIASRKQLNDLSWSIEFKVPIDQGVSDPFRIYHISLKYEDGWKLDGSLPFTTKNSRDIEAGQTHTFQLTDEQMIVYKAFSKDLNETHLKGLDPISIALLYVQAEWEGRYDIAYALYTDREGYVNWTKEYDENIPSSDRISRKQIPIAYAGFAEGKFIQTGDFTGYIEFTNSGSKHGFQMIQDEDGIWNVAFMPLQ